MPDPTEKTNAMRMLDQRKVPYDTYTYDDSVHHSAAEVADMVGVPREQVFKTLVMLRPRGRPLLVMVPGHAEVDPRRLADALDEKSVQMAPHRDAERLTGLKVGGIGALALLGKPFDVCIDRSALEHERILVNPGRRGINVGVPVSDLLRLTSARVVDATGTESREESE
jgi:Cys-tRNA(Pro)/Cys-tRNA(Cys) deacylase